MRTLNRSLALAALVAPVVLVVLVVLGVGGRVAPAADGAVNVLTTTTDLADIVRAVGGDQVLVRSLCKGPEDPHFLDARPSFLRMGGEADLLVVVGLEMEAGYLPLILRDGGNPRIKPGTPGYLDASARIKKQQVVEGGTVSRARGDPHYLLDPANCVIVADDVARALSALRPAAKARFEERAKAFRTAVSDLLLGAPPTADPMGGRVGGLLDRFKPFRGAGIVSYHDDMVYLAQRYGLTVVGTLEPKPGVPPTAVHLAQLTERAKAGTVRAILHEVYQPSGPVRSFSEGIGAKPVLVAHQPGATPDAPDLLAMHRRNAEAILAALGEAPAK